MSPRDQTLDEYRLKIGNVTLGIRLSPQKYEPLLPEYFNRPSATSPVDCMLAIQIAKGGSNTRVPNSLYYGKKISANGFTLADGLIRGSLLPGGKGIELRVPQILVSGRSIKIFEHLLHQAFYAAARQKSGLYYLIHSAGIIHDDAGYLFVGASRAGKTTVAKLSKSDRVVNDEICLIRLSKKAVRLYGTPFNGFFADKVEAQALLKAIFLLAPRKANKVVPVQRSEAVSGVFQQIVPPVGLNESVGKSTYARMLEAADRLCSMVPVRKLEFKRDGGFWRQIDRMVERGDVS